MAIFQMFNSGENEHNSGLLENHIEMTHKIHVIGLGVADAAILASDARNALGDADMVIGSERQLAMVADMLDIMSEMNQDPDNRFQTQQVILPKLAELEPLILANQALKIVVLASGDPLHYGIGRWLTKKLGNHNLQFHGGVSSVQAACHHLGLALQDIEVLSLHGRPLAKIYTVLNNNHKLVVLTDKNSQPQHLAQACMHAGFNDSKITVCERLGYEDQIIRSFNVADLANGRECFNALHVSVVEVQGKGAFLPNFPGIEDQHFITGREAGKGMITKREVRVQILSLLQASRGDVIWDIGAGCGSVAVELAYWQPNANIYAIEHHPDRLNCLAANQQRFGVVANLHTIAGRAPEQLAELPMANKVFVGGSDGELSEILQQSWQQLPVGGVLVASAIMESTKSKLHTFSDTLTAEESATESMQVAISKGTKLAGQLVYKPNYPVTLYRFIKL